MTKHTEDTVKTSVTTRARSLYRDDPAEQFIGWLTRRWNELTPEQKATATMECRPKDDFAMVGLRWTEKIEAK